MGIGDWKDGHGTIVECRYGNEIDYEGEYLYGKRNGYGKIPNNYEGTFLNGEKHGKGKDYMDGIAIYEGEYLNGIKWNGKERQYFNESGYILYEGEYLNGQRWNGKGIEFSKMPCHLYHMCTNINDHYEVEYLNGKKMKAKKIDENETNFEIKDGKGFLDTEDLFYRRYAGEYLNGEKNGFGKEVSKDTFFEGEFLDGKRW